MLEKALTKGAIELGSNKRSQVTTVRSIQDISAQVEDLSHKDDLYLELFRDSKNANLYKLKIMVPRTVTKPFTTSVLLKSQVVGPVSKRITVKFDPANVLLGASDSELAGLSFEGNSNAKARTTSKDGTKATQDSASVSMPASKTRASESESAKDMSKEQRSLSSVVMGWALVVVVTFFILESTCKGSA